MKVSVFAAVVAAAGMLAACSGNDSSTTFVRCVEVTEPTAVEPVNVRHFTGRVKAGTKSRVAFKTPGQLERIYVTEGQHISAGQKVAELDKKDYALGVEAAQAQYDQMVAETARLRKLYEAQSVSKNDLDKAESGLKQLAVQLKNNRNKLEYTTLTAPHSGIVESVSFERGELVDAGTPVITLVSTGRGEIEAGIPRSLYERRHLIRSISGRHGGRTFPLSVKAFLPVADNSQLHTMLLNIDADITPGVNIDIAVETADSTYASHGFRVPASAVIRTNDGKAAVFVVEGDSVIRRRAVSVSGFDAERDIIVTDGISAGDRLVRAGASLLHDGERVRVTGVKSETNIGNLR